MQTYPQKPYCKPSALTFLCIRGLNEAEELSMKIEGLRE
jgi:hypothetical protein